MNINKVKSFAKINLALHITGKLTKLHKIESVVKFIELHDLITIKKINSKKHHISFNGNFSQNINKNKMVSFNASLFEWSSGLRQAKLKGNSLSLVD